MSGQNKLQFQVGLLLCDAGLCVKLRLCLSLGILSYKKNAGVDLQSFDLMSPQIFYLINCSLLTDVVLYFSYSMLSFPVQRVIPILKKFC